MEREKTKPKQSSNNNKKENHNVLLGMNTCLAYPGLGFEA
jgi:hypothetical protein